MTRLARISLFRNLLHNLALRNLAALLILMLVATSHAHAQGGCATGGTGCGSFVPPAPEIDPSLATGAAALLGGTVLLIRGRRRP
jgi:hypothetical protein